MVERLKKAIILLQVMVNGKTVQYSNDALSWVSADQYAVLNYPERCRIKPETREGWINVYPEGKDDVLHPTREKAERFAGENCINCVKVTYDV